MGIKFSGSDAGGFRFDFSGANSAAGGSEGSAAPKRERKPRKAVGTPGKRIAINSLVTLFVGAVYFYLELPAINLHAEEFYATYGSLFFLALVLSTVFLLASVLMLYYKQLSEGYEDAARFAVMQRVGMTKRDIRTSVNAQLRMVFLLPLLAAFVHLAFAQPMIWRILRLFGLQNLPLVLGVTACACAVFTVLYCAACRLTSNAYCRIVGEGV